MVILEIKAVGAILPVHRSAVADVLEVDRTSRLALLNFNVPMMKDGIVRMINTQ
jgi:hypothetical protein